jgi:hypothetical protein
MRSVWMMGLVACLSMACSQETAEAGAGSEDDVVSGESDAVKTETVTAKPQWNACRSDIQYLKVTAGVPDAVASKVNARLADPGTLDESIFTRPSILGQCAATGYAFVRGRMTAKHNGGGLLSVLEKVEFFDANNLIDVRIRTYTFDMKSGERLSLSDVFTDAGLARIRQQCLAPASRLTSGDAATECAMTTERVGGTYTFERGGVRLYPFPFQALERGILLSWKDVGADLKHPAAKKLAQP